MGLLPGLQIEMFAVLDAVISTNDDSSGGAQALGNFAM
jgi:hypothetical protein